MDEKFLREVDGDLSGWANPVARLRDALEKNEFALYCQPIRTLGGGETFPMAEVLVRLREEETALLPPGEFFPIFEHHKMMPQLDRWVARNVIARLARGSKVPRFTVNVHGQTLDDEAFALDLRDEIQRAGIRPASLMFEIDELDALAKPAAAAAFAASVKAAGNGLLIDGFGRRSVSFAPISDLRVDFIKIDGSITRRILTNQTAETKLKAVVRVAQTIGIGVVAECVEEQDVLLRLKALGVDHVQGFGVYRPHPIDAIAG